MTRSLIMPVHVHSILLSTRHTCHVYIQATYYYGDSMRKNQLIAQAWKLIGRTEILMSSLLP